MSKFFSILLFCFSILSCHNETGGNETGAKSEQPAKTLMSKKEMMEASSRFDSLMLLVKKLKGPEKNDSTTKYLYESLSLAQQLNNDTMLARVYRNLGWYFDDIAEYNLEVDFLYKAFEACQKMQNYEGCASALNDIAWAYIQAYDYKNGIEQALRGIEMAKKITKTENQSRITSYLCSNLAIAYLECNMPDSALKYNELSYSTFYNFKPYNYNHYSWVFAQFGNIYAYKKDYIEAEKCFKKVMDVKDSSSVADALVYAISKYCNFLNKRNRHSEAIDIGREGIVTAKNAGLKRYLIDIADELSYSFEKLHQMDSAYRYAKMAKELRDEAFNIKKSIQLQNMSFNRDLKAKELKYEIEKANAEEKLKSAQMLRNIFLLGLVFVMLFAGMFLYQRNKIKAGKIRSDELLLNILPEEVAEELKSKGITSAKQFENVTVMFTDFKNFTQIAERLSPQELVSEIHTCFKAFDEIIEKHKVEKIKTIGDAYMCVGGLPVSNTTHAIDVVRAALEIQQYIVQHSKQRKADGNEFFEIRIGIHTGPVVAGIVGIKKFAYDIWGDTVNTASRMESSAGVGKVNISGTTYELVKDKFNCTYRGKIEAKNKGELDMYYVDGNK